MSLRAWRAEWRVALPASRSSRGRGLVGDRSEAPPGGPYAVWFAGQQDDGNWKVAADATEEEYHGSSRHAR